MTATRLFRIWTAGILMGGFFGSFSRAVGGDSPPAPPSLIWTSASTNSSGSMPLGNGDIGLNAWVEENGDLLFYLSKTDAWDEQARLLKLGRIRVQFSPNPFRSGGAFRQELNLQTGSMQIEAGPTNSSIRMELWADANHPVVQFVARGERPFAVRVRLELWRVAERALVGGEEQGTDTPSADWVPVVHPDSVVDQQTNQVVWFHRNESSLWPSTLRHQGLVSVKSQFKDPLLNRTFGGLIQGDGLVAESPIELRSSGLRQEMSFSIYASTAQADSSAEWLSELKQLVSRTERLRPEVRWEAHRAWWASFWRRSWLYVSNTPNGPALSQGYTLQRFMNACAGRGAFPIKFNGSIFTVEGPTPFDPDYRRWGGCYWFQNTRLIYWPMLAEGDFDLMQPLFRMYRDMLPFARARTQVYFHHKGAFFPETLHFWGAYHNGELGYGWDRENEPIGRAKNQYIRYYWSSGLELTALMIDYYNLTRDEDFLRNTLLPLADAILEFYRDHYPRGARGRLLIVPAQSLETWWQSDNPLPEIAGLHFVIRGLLDLSSPAITEDRHAAWKDLAANLPDLPTRVDRGETVLAAGESFSNRENSENPELYAIFPYRVFGVNKPDLELARRTFGRRQFQGNYGWQQDDTQMACLGLAKEAACAVVDRFTRINPSNRFPAFWGPNFDWIPDQDHGGNGLMALQSMLLQFDRNKIYLFPAWPKDWDVEFKLNAPGQTTIEGSFCAGELKRLVVNPPERERDLIRCVPQ